MIRRPARARLLRRLLFVVSVLGWAVFAYATVFAITTGWQETTGNVRQVDWHVYLAGAHGLVHGTLYTKPLALGSYPLSSPEFNLPPLSALWALPLLPLPVEVGGDIWQLLGAVSIAIAALAAADLAGLRRPWAWAGVALGILSLTLVYLEGLHLATNNYLVLGLVAGFAWLFLRRHERTAGALLGIAIGTKLWPVVLLAVVLRERRWTVLAWCAGAIAVQLVIFSVWLGPGSWFDMARLIRIHIPPTGILIGPTAVHGLREVWNAGLGIAVAIVLLLIPARGRVGIGIAIVAGMAPIANLWVHYGPTILFALALLLAAGWAWLPRTVGGEPGSPEALSS